MGSLGSADRGVMNGDRKGPRSHPDEASASPWRTAAAVGIGVEALALGVYAVAYGLHATALPEPAFAIGLACFYGLVAFGLGAVARAFRRGARWAVTASLTWQALLALAGINLTGVRPGYGAALAAVAVAVGVLVLLGGRAALRAPRDA